MIGLNTFLRASVKAARQPHKLQDHVQFVGLGTILALLLTGCTIAPHGSRATHQIWTYAPGSRADGLVRYEKITDRSAGGGAQVGTFTQLQNVSVVHTNSMMRVGGMLTIGNAYIGVDTNTASVVTALGTAAGDVIGAAMKTAVKP